MWRRRLIRLGVISVVTLLVLVAGALVVVQTDWFKNWLRGFAVARTASLLNGRLSIGGLSGSLFRGVTLERVALEQDGAVIISADRVVVSYDPYVLIRGSFDFEQLRVERPVVRVVETADGWNVAHLVKPSNKPRESPLALYFRRIELVDGIVTIDPLEMAERSLSDVDSHLRLTTDAKGLQLAIDRFSAMDDVTGGRVTELSGEAANSFSSFGFTLSAARGPAQLAGRVTGDLAAPIRRVGGDVQVTRLDLAPLLEDTMLESEITGRTQFDLSLPRGGAPMRADFTFQGPFARAMGYEASDVRAEGNFSDGRLLVNASGLAYGARVSAMTDWSTATKGKPATLETRGEFASMDLRRVPKKLAVPSLESRLNGRFRADVAGSRWSADVLLSSSTMLGAAIEPGMVGHVESREDAVSYSAGGRLGNVDISRFAAPLELPILADERYRGRLGGDVYAFGRTGDAKSRLLVAGADLRDSIVGGATMERMRASVAMIGSRLAIDAHGDFTGAGRVLLGLPESTEAVLNGTVDASVLLPDIGTDLDINTIEAVGRVALSSSTIQDVSITTGLVDASVARGIATISELAIDGPEAKATGKGTLAFGSEGESAFELVADATDVTQLAKRFDVDAKGQAHLEAKVTGPSSAMVATGVLNGHSLAYGETASALTLNSTFTARVADRQFADARVEAKSEGTFLTIGGLEIVRLAATSSYQQRQLELDARIEQTERSVDLAGSVLFQPEAQEVRLRRFEAATAGTVWTLPQNQEATIRYAKGTVDVAGLTLQSGAQRIEAAGGVATNEEAVAATSPLNVRMVEVQVADLNRMLLGTKKLEGRLNGTADVRGLITNPTVTATVAVTDGVVENAKFQSLAGNIALADRVATIDMRLDESNVNSLTARGTVPLPGEPVPATPLDVQVTTAAIDIGLIQAFTNELEKVAGTAQADVRVTGSLNAPLVNGNVSLSKGQFSLASTGVSYRDVNSNIRVTDNRLVIDSWQMNDDDGHALTLTGGLDVATADARTVDIKITTQGFHVLRNTLGDIEVDASLTVAGDLSAPRVEGSLRLQQGRLEVDEVLERTTKNAYRTSPDVPTPTPKPAAPGAETATPIGAPAAPAAPPTTGSFFDRTSINIALELPGNLVLRGRDMRVASASLGLGDMNMTVGGELTLEKAPGSSSVVVVGALEVIRGYYDFQGRRFEVSRGSGVRFRGEQPIDPSLAITAEREISGVTAKVQVNGRVSEPTIALSSTPPLDEGDVLSLIVFNTPINQLGESERVSLAERAGVLAAGVIASPIASSVARALNLDQFEIQASGTNGAGPSVSLGSQIGTRIFLGVRQEFGRNETSTVSFEYRFADFLRLVTSVAQGPPGRSGSGSRRAGTSAADLIFVIRY